MQMTCIRNSGKIFETDKVLMTVKSPTWSLKLSEHSTNDFGNFSCQATNNLGTVRGYCEVTGKIEVNQDRWSLKWKKIACIFKPLFSRRTWIQIIFDYLFLYIFLGKIVILPLSSWPHFSFTLIHNKGVINHSF